MSHGIVLGRSREEANCFQLHFIPPDSLEVRAAMQEAARLSVSDDCLDARLYSSLHAARAVGLSLFNAPLYAARGIGRFVVDLTQLDFCQACIDLGNDLLDALKSLVMGVLGVCYIAAGILFPDTVYPYFAPLTPFVDAPTPPLVKKLAGDLEEVKAQKGRLEADLYRAIQGRQGIQQQLHAEQNRSMQSAQAHAQAQDSKDRHFAEQARALMDAGAQNGALQQNLKQAGQREQKLQQDLQLKNRQIGDLNQRLQDANKAEQSLTDLLGLANQRSEKLLKTHQDEIDRLERQNQEQQRAVKQLKAACLSADANQEALTAKLTAAQKEMQQRQGRIESLIKELEAARTLADGKQKNSEGSIAQLTAALQEARRSGEDAQKNTEALTAQLRAAQQEAQQGLGLIQSLTQGLEAARKLAEGNQKTAGELAAQLRTAQQESQQRQGKIDELAKQLQEARRSSGDAQKNTEALTVQLGAAQQEAQQGRGRIEGLTQELEAARKLADGNQKTAGQLDAQLRVAQQEVQQRQSKIDELAKQLQETQRSGGDVQKHAGELAAQLRTAQQEVQQRQGRIDELTKQLEFAYKFADSNQKNTGELAAQLTAAEQELQQRQGRIDELAKQLQESQHSGGNAQKNTEALTAQLRAAQQTVEQRQGSIEELIKELEAAYKLADGNQKNAGELAAQLAAERKETQQRQSKIEELTKELEAARKLNEGNQKNTEGLTIQLKTAQQEAQQGRERIEGLTKELEAVRKLAEGNQKNTGELDAQLRAAQQELQQRQGQIDELAKQLQEAQRSGRDAQQNTEALTAQLAAERKETQQRQSKIEELTKELEAARKLSGDNQKTAGELDAQLKNAQQEVQQRQSKIDELGKQLQEAQRSSGDAQKNRETLTAQLAAAQQEVLQGKGRIDELAKELEAARKLTEGNQKDAGELAAQLTAAQREVQQGQSRIDELTKERDAARKLSGDNQTTAGQLDAQLRIAQQELQQSQAQIEGLAKQLQEAQRSGGDAQKNTEALTAQLTAERKETQQRQGKIENLTQELEAAYKLADGNQKNAGELAAQLTAAQQELQQRQSKIEELTKELEAARKLAENNQKNAGELDTQLKTARQDVQQRQAQLEGLSKQLQEAQRSGGEARKNAGQLDDQLRTAQQESQQRQAQIDELAKQLQEAQRSGGDAQKNTEALTAQLAAERKETQQGQSKIEELTKELEAAYQLAEGNQKAAEELTALLKASNDVGFAEQAKVQQRQSEIERLTKELEAARKLAQDNQDNMRGLTAQLADAQEQNALLKRRLEEATVAEAAKKNRAIPQLSLSQRQMTDQTGNSSPRSRSASFSNHKAPGGTEAHLPVNKGLSMSVDRPVSSDSPESFSASGRQQEEFGFAIPAEVAEDFSESVFGRLEESIQLGEVASADEEEWTLVDERGSSLIAPIWRALHMESKLIHDVRGVITFDQNLHQKINAPEATAQQKKEAIGMFKAKLLEVFPGKKTSIEKAFTACCGLKEALTIKDALEILVRIQAKPTKTLLLRYLSSPEALQQQSWKDEDLLALKDNQVVALGAKTPETIAEAQKAAQSLQTYLSQVYGERVAKEVCALHREKLTKPLTSGDFKAIQVSVRVHQEEADLKVLFEDLQRPKEERKLLCSASITEEQRAFILHKENSQEPSRFETLTSQQKEALRFPFESIPLMDSTPIAFKKGQIVPLDSSASPGEKSAAALDLKKCLAATYGKRLAELICGNDAGTHGGLYNLHAHKISRELTWGNLKEILVSLSVQKTVDDLKALYEDLKQGTRRLECGKVLTRAQREFILQAPRFEALSQEQLRVLMLPFTTIHFGPVRYSIFDVVCNEKSPGQHVVEFNQFRHDADVLQADLESYNLNPQYPAYAIGEHKSKQWAYLELEKGMILELPSGDALERREFYQVIDTLPYKGDAVVACLTMPLNPDYGSYTPQNPLTLDLNFRGTRWEPAQKAAQASINRDVDPTGIGRSSFEKREAEIIDMIAKHLKSLPPGTPVALKINGHSLGGCDVQRGFELVLRTLSQLASMEQEIESCLASYLAELGKQKLNQPYSEELKKPIQHLNTRLQNESGKLNHKHFLREFPLLKASLKASLASISAWLNLPLQESRARIKGILETMRDQVRQERTDRHFSKIKKIEMMPHNPPAANYSLNASIKASVKILENCADIPDRFIKGSYIYFEPDPVEKFGAIFALAEVKSRVVDKEIAFLSTKDPRGQGVAAHVCKAFTCDSMGDRLIDEAQLHEQIHAAELVNSRIAEEQKKEVRVGGNAQAEWAELHQDNARALQEMKAAPVQAEAEAYLHTLRPQFQVHVIRPGQGRIAPEVAAIQAELEKGHLAAEELKSRIAELKEKQSSSSSATVKKELKEAETKYEKHLTELKNLEKTLEALNVGQPEDELEKILCHRYYFNTEKDSQLGAFAKHVGWYASYAGVPLQAVGHRVGSAVIQSLGALVNVFTGRR